MSLERAGKNFSRDMYKPLLHTHTNLGRYERQKRRNWKVLKCGFTKECYKQNGRITHKEILTRVGAKRWVWKSITKRRDQLLEYVIRHNRLLIIKRHFRSKAWKKRGVVRPAVDYIAQIIKDVCCREKLQKIERVEEIAARWYRGHVLSYMS